MEPEGFQDFFVREWGRKETLIANSGTLMALYKYLLKIALKFGSKREVMDEIRRKHFKEESSQLQSMDNSDATVKISAEFLSQFNIFFFSFALAILCCAIVTRKSIIPLNRQRFRTIHFNRYYESQLYCTFEILKELKCVVAEQYVKEVRPP